MSDPMSDAEVATPAEVLVETPGTMSAALVKAHAALRERAEVRQLQRLAGIPLQSVKRTVREVPVPDGDLFPEVYNLPKQEEAYRRFIVMEEPLSSIAQSLQVPLVTVLHWASMGDWVGRRDKLMQTREKDEFHQLSLERLKVRRGELGKQVEVGQQIREAVQEALAGVTTPDGLMKLSKAAKDAADIATRALGVDDSGAPAAERSAQAGAESKRPLVVIIPGGGLPPVKPADEPKSAVDVESVDAAEAPSV